MGYKKKRKKHQIYNPQYSYKPKQDFSTVYAYHDIDEHYYEIKKNLAYSGLENPEAYRFVMVSNDVKDGEINAPGYPDGARVSLHNEVFNLTSENFIVNNKESKVNDFGVAISSKFARRSSFSWAYEIVIVEMPF